MFAAHNGTDMNEHHKAILSHVDGQDCLFAGYKDEQLQDVWVLQDSAGQRRLSFSAGCDGYQMINHRNMGD